MQEAERKTALVVTMIAVAASVVVLSGLYWSRVRAGRMQRRELRGVSEILSEFSERMQQLQAQLSSPERGPSQES